MCSKMGGEKVRNKLCTTEISQINIYTPHAVYKTHGSPVLT